MTSKSGKHGWSLIINGYMRTQNQTLQLEIPQDINTLVCKFYDQRRYFDNYNNEKFKVSDDGITLKGIGPIDNITSHCFMVYPSPNGYNKGIHTWTIKYVDELMLLEIHHLNQLALQQI